MASGSDDPGGITRLLVQLDGPNEEIVDRLLPLVYDELRAMARARLRGERPDHTLSPTALVHEAYLKLVDQTRVDWRNRAHFFAIAARAMRRILINHANAHFAAKRGGGAPHVTLDEAAAPRTHGPAELLELDEALSPPGGAPRAAGPRRRVPLLRGSRAA